MSTPVPDSAEKRSPDGADSCTPDPAHLWHKLETGFGSLKFGG